jgi:uncharacterized protein
VRAMTYLLRLPDDALPQTAEHVRVLRRESAACAARASSAMLLALPRSAGRAVLAGENLACSSSVRAVQTASICLIAGFLLSQPGVVFAQQPAAPESVVVTTGEGVVRAVPDQAWVTITAESRAPTPRDAQQRNADAMRPVLEKLRSVGVPSDAIRTVAYDLREEWDFVNNRRVSRGFVARNSVEVRVDEIERVGEVLEVAVGSGATSVSGLRFDLKNRTSLEHEALRQAVADARAKAEAAASGAGRTVDRILRIEEQGAVVPVPRPMMREMLQVSQADATPPIETGQIELRAQVTVTAVLR